MLEFAHFVKHHGQGDCFNKHRGHAAQYLTMTTSEWDVLFCNNATRSMNGITDTSKVLEEYRHYCIFSFFLNPNTEVKNKYKLNFRIDV